MKDFDQTGRRPQNIVALVVEDDPYFLKMMAQQLAQLGISDISVADNGATALQRMQSSPRPNLILCDLQMPTMNGIEFLRQLHFESFEGDIVLISGEQSRTIESASELLRAYGLKLLGGLGKPVTLEVLARTIFDLPSNDPGGTEASPSMDACYDKAVVDDILSQQKMDVVFEPLLNCSDDSTMGVVARPSRLACDPAPFAASGAYRFMQAQAQTLLSRFYPCALEVVHEALQIQTSWTLALELPAIVLAQAESVDALIYQALKKDVPPERIQIHLAGSIEQLPYDQVLQAAGHLTLKGFSLWAAGHDRSMQEMELLLRLPLQGYFIDPVLLHRAQAAKPSGAFFQQQVEFGHALNLQVGAAAVDSQAQYECCMQAGCDVALGAAIAPALSAQALATWARWQASRQQP